MLKVGQGYDIHATKPGDGIPIGGVFIPAEFAFIAHSDGDVLIHAICDCLLGALGLGDIGDQFPDTDPKYKGIDSKLLLSKVHELVENQGYHIVNLDCSVILQAPKLSTHKKAIAASLASLLKTPIENINVKAKTKEKQDATGQGKAVEAQCVVLLQKDGK